MENFYPLRRFFLFIPTCFIAILLCIDAAAQSGDSCLRTSSYQKAFENEKFQNLYDVIQLPDGSLAAVGLIVTAPNNPDALLLRLNESGKILWAKKTGGTGIDIFQYVKATADGGLIACGYTTSATGKNSIMAVKFSTAGLVEWSKSFSLGSGAGDKPADIIQTPDGGYAIAATAFMGGGTDALVIKINSAGNFLWSRQFHSGNTDEAKGIVSVGDTLVVSGFHNPQNGDRNAFLMKLSNADGTLWWGRSYDRNGMEDRFLGIQRYKDGYVVADAVSFTSSDNAYKQAFTILNSTGDILMSKKMDLQLQNFQYHSISPTNDNGFLCVLKEPFASVGPSSPQIIRLDSAGNVLWNRGLSNSSIILGNIIQTRDGSYLGAGNNGYNAFIVKTDDRGRTTGCPMRELFISLSNDVPLVQALSWASESNVIISVAEPAAINLTTVTESERDICRFSPCTQPSTNCFTAFQKTYGGTGDNEALDVIQTTDGSSLVSGRTTSGTNGDYDGLLLKLDNKGQISWSKKFGGDKDDAIHLSRSLSDGNYISAGTTASFGNTNGGLWLLKTDANGNLLWSRHYTAGNKEKPMQLVELANGELVIAGNTNDSTVANNAWLLRLSANGDVTWSKQYDNGLDDGFHDVLARGDTLVVSGYATVDKKDGILAMISASNGQMLWSNKYVKAAGLNDEVLNVFAIPEGYALGIASYNPDASSDRYHVSMLKISGSGQLLFGTQVREGFTKPRLFPIRMEYTPDQGFVYTSNMGMANGFARKINATGNGQWTTVYDEVSTDFRLHSIKNASGKGYLVAGYVRNQQTSNRKKIWLLRSDDNGGSADCYTSVFCTGSDTTNFTISAFNWTTISDYQLLQSGIISPASNSLSLETSTECSTTRCDSTQQLTDSCSTTFRLTLSSEKPIYARHSLQTQDGGYMLAGDHNANNCDFFNGEAMLMKLAKNGTIEWSKTFSIYNSNGKFHTLAHTHDDKIAAAGLFWRPWAGGSRISSVVLAKMDYAGNVLWTKQYALTVNGGPMTGGEGGVLKSLPNGEFLLLVQMGSVTILAKLDVAGNILWQRKMMTLGNLHAFKEMVFDETSVYILGDTPNSSPGDVEINKLDLASGNLEFTQRIVTPGFNNKLLRAFLQRDTMYVAMNVSQPGVRSHNLSIVKIDPPTGLVYNASRINSHEFSSPDGSDLSNPYVSPRIIDLTADGSFVFVGQGTWQTGNSMFAGKLLSNGTFEWMKKYAAVQNIYPNSVEVNGSNILVTYGIMENYIFSKTGFIRMDSAGNIRPQNESGSCSNELITGSVTSLLVENRAGGSQPADNLYALAAIAQTPLLQDIPAQVTANCITPGVCSEINISGQDTICSLTDTYIFKATRNAGCTNAVNWSVDTSFATIISFTDSTVTVRFKKYGQVSLMGRFISGCQQLTRSKIISIPILPSINLGPDKTICPGNQLILHASPGFRSYQWQDGSTDSVFTVTQPGKYHVSVTDACNRIISDTVDITPTPSFTIDLGTDVSKCDTQSVTLSAPAGFAGYTWSPNYQINNVNTGQVIVNPGVTTMYKVIVERADGCKASDSVLVNVHYAPAIYLGPDTSFCSGNSITLNAGSGFKKYQWNTGDTTSLIAIVAKGIYTIHATDSNNCSSRDTFEIKQLYPLPQGFVDPVATFCPDAKTTLAAKGSFIQYRWSTGSISHSIEINAPGRYWLEVANADGCVNREYIDVKHASCLNFIHFPNAFTPNNDRTNETFKPVSQGNFARYRFIIYNRWGQKVFETTDPSKGWDGKIKGATQDSNAFVWYCSYQFLGEPERNARGTVMLVK